MTRTRTAVWATCLAIASAAPLARAQGGGTRTIYVTVVDNKHAPITDLTAADFTVKEGGKARAVSTAEVAKAPLQVAVLIDDDDQGGKSVPGALSAFAKRLAGHGELAVITTRGGPVMRADFSTDTNALVTAIDALPLVSPGLAYLPNGLLDVSQSLAKRNASRPVIVAIASPGMTVSATEDGPDGRVPTTKTIGAIVNPSSPSAPLVLDALHRSHALFYVMHLDTYQARGENNEPPDVHYSWPLDAPAQSGGRTDRLVTAQGLEAAFDRLADELLGQYAVTYESPDAPTNVALNVDVKRKGASVHAPQRAY